MKLLFAAALAVLIPGAAVAGTPREALEDANSRIKQAVSKPAPKGSPSERRMKDEVKKVVTDLLDYGELAKRAMGKFWAERTAGEQAEFTGMLRDLIEASYLGKISGNADYRVEFLDESEEDGDALVNTRASAKSGSVNVGYRMHRAGDRWLCFDLLIDEVSTLRNYKAEFNKIIKEQGYPALVRKMKDKLAEVKKDGGTAPSDAGKKDSAPRDSGAKKPVGKKASKTK
jgi:phospholipid transport system substrate-binding protein